MIFRQKNVKKFQILLSSSNFEVFSYLFIFHIDITYTVSIIICGISAQGTPNLIAKSGNVTHNSTK